MVNKCVFLSGKIVFAFELKLLSSAMHQTNSLFNLDLWFSWTRLHIPHIQEKDATPEVLGSLR